MWKISRNLIFNRWPKKQKYGEHNKSSVLSKKTTYFPPGETKRSSGKDHSGKQQFKQSERFWNCENMKVLLFKSTFLEKAGWLGTVTILCFNLHFKHFQFKVGYEKRNSHCLLSRNVFAVPQDILSSTTKQKAIHGTSKDKETEEKSLKTLIFPSECTSQKIPVDVNTLDNFRDITVQYAAAVQNLVGLSSLKSNKKKAAFRYFQKAARLGSSQALYNLGLCFELGNGTQQNLTRAAFCYKKAAMNGHGLASFNLAVFFMKGLGGLPVDHEIARHLLTQAAEKDVTEAQLFIALDCLEQENYSEAFQLFNILANKNVLDGKYYLGLCYENGWGVTRNECIATEIFSEAAKSGHSKSVLKLSRYYEQGIGGCDTDLDFSTALCQILDDPKDEELRTTLIRLKLKKATISNKQLCDETMSFAKKGTQMRTSMSVPELKSFRNKENSKNSQIFITQSYLDLVTPFVPTPAKYSNAQKSKNDIFYIEDKTELNSAIAPVQVFSFKIPHLMVAKS